MKYLQQEVGRAWVCLPLGMSLGEGKPRLSLPLVGGIYHSREGDIYGSQVRELIVGFAFFTSILRIWTLLGPIQGYLLKRYQKTQFVCFSKDLLHCVAAR